MITWSKEEGICVVELTGLKEYIAYIPSGGAFGWITNADDKYKDAVIRDIKKAFQDDPDNFTGWPIEEALDSIEKYKARGSSPENDRALMLSSYYTNYWSGVDLAKAIDGRKVLQTFEGVIY